MSLTQTPAPDSLPARYFSFPAARRTEKTWACRWASSRSTRAGACIQAAMYGVGVGNSASNRFSRSR